MNGNNNFVPMQCVTAVITSTMRQASIASKNLEQTCLEDMTFEHGHRCSGLLSSVNPFTLAESIMETFFHFFFQLWRHVV